MFFFFDPALSLVEFFLESPIVSRVVLNITSSAAIKDRRKRKHPLPWRTFLLKKYSSLGSHIPMSFHRIVVKLLMVAKYRGRGFVFNQPAKHTN